jgi:hypothetical protein
MDAAPLRPLTYRVDRFDLIRVKEHSDEATPSPFGNMIS